MSELFVNIGTALTGVLGWFTSMLAVIETALETSVILWLVLGITAVSVAPWIIRKVIGIVKSFRPSK